MHRLVLQQFEHEFLVARAYWYKGSLPIFFFFSGVKAEEKKGGAGKGNWGTIEDDIEAKVF
jgi:hypothetical protein